MQVVNDADLSAHKLNVTVSPTTSRTTEENIRDEIREDRAQLIQQHNMTIEDSERQLKLKKLIDYESSNWQWDKLAMTWGLILILTLISLMRG